jgi:hypothetical protein
MKTIKRETHTKSGQGALHRVDVGGAHVGRE